MASDDLKHLAADQCLYCDQPAEWTIATKWANVGTVTVHACGAHRRKTVKSVRSTRREGQPPLGVQQHSIYAF